MIQASVCILAGPEQRDGILQALRLQLDPTRVEPGCLSCRLLEDVETAGAFTLLEEWATPTDLERRLGSESYRRLLMIVELSESAPEVRYQVIASTMGLEAIHAVRERASLDGIVSGDEASR